ncbi:transglycosylase SLT domain-containing protein [Nocardia mexicana]|uniref:Transglycosylase-like protein with SLT domain n=1 Tax=Nocardia mexicana TaxID=279262 RepID=A0A370GRP9_9NOCA|nr:transglycosylase SLT domain-containing protein [Nocardia mexicana]RDI46382.1 transglycosylase-like protein with SLT domain [Nocardia mexicana]
MPQPRSRTARWVATAGVTVLLAGALTVGAAIAAADEVALGPCEAGARASAAGPGAAGTTIDNNKPTPVRAGVPRATGTDFVCAARIPVASSLIPDLVAMSLGAVPTAFRMAPKGMALLIVPPHQFPAFDNVITRESGWNTFAVNKESGAYGLGQALPAHKMGTHGLDWCCNPLTQIRWTYDYMNQRYGGPDGAWAFWQSHGWY